MWNILEYINYHLFRRAAILALFHDHASPRYPSLLPAWSGSLSGSTGTGLDQLISWLGRDPGLRGSTDAPSLAAGIAAADALNQLIATGLASLGRSSALVLTPDDLIALNVWIRSNPAHLQGF